MKAIVQSGQHVLVVEADDLMRELVERWLGEAGYRVQTEVRAGPDAASLAKPPDLVIVDVSNPRRARPLVLALQCRHAAPLLLISSRFRRGLGDSVAAAQQLGVQRLLAKPFTQAELLAAVAGAMGQV